MANQSVPYIIHTQDDLKDFLELRDQLLIESQQTGEDPQLTQSKIAHLEPFQQILPDYKSTVPQQPPTAVNPSGRNFTTGFGR